MGGADKTPLKETPAILYARGEPGDSRDSGGVGRAVWDEAVRGSGDERCGERMRVHPRLGDL